MARGRLDVLRDGEAIEAARLEGAREGDPALDLASACALASAWSADLSVRLGVRMLIIKGPSLAHHGLREPRTSADVDVLVEPDRFDEYCAALRAAGWVERPTTEVGAVWAPHSGTYLHPNWPCDIDVHRYFPGFLEPPGVTFDLLWNARESITVAHRPALIPSRTASLLIAGLHQLRDGVGRADTDQLRALQTAGVTEAERGELVELAVATGALEPARELLLTLGIAEGDLPRTVESAAGREWRARTDANASGAFFWMLLLERTPPRERLGLLRRAIWPSRATLRINHPDSADTLVARASLRLARIPASVRGLPAAIAAMSARRRGV